MLYRTAFALPLIALATAQSESESPILPADDCPILGPNFPSDFDPNQSHSIKEAIKSFPSLIDILFESEKIPKNATSFYIDVFSAQTNASIYNYSHSAELLDSALTTGNLDDNTIFRIGSVSKLHTVYAILNVAGIEVFQHPVTQYLPELKGNTEKSKIIWEEITVGALASQQGGTGGFPFLAEMRDLKRPIIPAFQTAVYSDAGFGVLGRVLERLTNQTYEDALQTHLAKPLRLPSTGGKLPVAEGLNALAIPGNSSVTGWGKDNHVTVSSGGLYSNAHDLRELGLSILHNELLCEDVTREWMKPRSHTASLTTSVGAPWEIYRLTVPVSPGSNRTRVSDLYTKLGGQVAYSAFLALSPDHDIGYSLLVAGTTATTDRIPLRDLIGEAFIPAAEAAAFENAAANYAGTFADPNNELSNLTLTVDEDKVGLGLPTLFIDGVNWLGNITELGLDPSLSDLFSYRLFPIGPEYTSSSNGLLVKKFSAVSGPADGAPRSQVEGGKGLFDDGCTVWETTGFYSTGDFELEVVKGQVTAVRMMDSNVTMTRVE
ncbi:hypothetical protein N0V90_000175 [Kalmusia sp. IMI 367209]|nr:hypothetical protein N0V90_000175 [Kalmusia sp. IMI 367209]